MSPTVQNGALDGITVWNGERELGPTSFAWVGDTITRFEPAGGASGSGSVGSSPVGSGTVGSSSAGGGTAVGDRFAGLSVIPGLIDTHVHLDTSVVDGAGPGDAWPLVTPDEEKALHVAAHAQRFAEYGVTTLRDLAASPIQIAVGRAFDQGVLPGPRLLSNGPVGMTAGHGDLFTPPRFRTRPPVADSPDECRKLVRQWAREGATGIKIYTSGGILSMGDQVGWRNQTRAEIAATVDEAHALGMLVAAHSHTAEGIEIALAEGVDSIEHATGMTDAQVARLVAADIPVAPTLLINDIVAAGAESIRAEASEKARAIVGTRDPVFLAAGRAGVRFVLGTDANGRFVRHGGQLDEVRLMQSAFGWSAERTLVAATSDAADSLKLGSRIGRLAAGLAPDFIVLRGRPWLDIADLDAANIVAVVSRGRVIAGALPTPDAAVA